MNRLKLGIFASSLSTAVSSGIETLFTITTNFLFSINTNKLYAYDGTTVEEKTFLPINDLEYIDESSITLAAGDNGLLLSSTNNITWTTINTPTSRDINVIKYADGVYFLGVDNE